MLEKNIVKDDGENVRVGSKPGKAQNEQMLSVLPPILAVKADIPDRQLRARTGREQSQQGSPLLDHLVGAGEQRRQMPVRQQLCS
jgi:hypothetical protein